ncbi:putative leucine-rich repeat-containing protein DDB_G0281931 isoform X2 [Stylophora pistillata]|nr:putative leucine-rich repeat-containing protein DDB_G0281931 isoform X2 [Stylophora pistillata]
MEEDALSSLTLLKYIDLSKNDLKSVPENTFRRNPLRYINLGNNAIQGGFYLPKSVRKLFVLHNKLSYDDMRVILKGRKRITQLDISGNQIGPNLTADLFDGFCNMSVLHLSQCGLKYIENGTFKAMRKLTLLDLTSNTLSYVLSGILEGPSEESLSLDLSYNELTSVPSFNGLLKLKDFGIIGNKITDISHLRYSTIRYIRDLIGRNNQIAQLPVEVFQKLNVTNTLDLSYNSLRTIPDEAFSACKQLTKLFLNFNNLSHITRQTFAGLKSLKLLMLTGNNLTSIHKDTFADTSLEVLFLHGNRIKHIDGNAFNHLKNLGMLTLFANPINLLQRDMFTGVATNVRLFITCKSLRTILPEIHNPLIECAPSASTYALCGDKVTYSLRYELSGSECNVTKPKPYLTCYNCSFCPAGTYGTHLFCVKCPKGGFYQDEMGQTECKNCSTGTYVPERYFPGKSATDCYACPYGTSTNESAGYRACSCLNNFYRLDRFGPCTACPSYGINCENDAAILAPNYFWKWSSTERKENYTEFVLNIYTHNESYNKAFSTFEGPLPKPVKCPYPDSCKGGINSTCKIGYKGILCATCSSHYYHRFNSCLRCPKMLVTIISCCVIVLLFMLLFVIVFWGDSRRTEDNRTVADVVMSCIKIVIGFYQVLAGIFSTLLQVQWPVILVSMTEYLKFVEGNILQFAPLSCIHPVLRLDPFIQFVLAITVNVFVISFILLYLLVKKHLINRMENSTEENSSEGIENFTEEDKSETLEYSTEEIAPQRIENCTTYTMRNSEKKKVAQLKKSCYRNIFLFLLLSYPMTSMKIINILPLPGVCVKVCFANDDNDCRTLLKADYSICCFTSRHADFWHIAAGFALYPIAFPILLLALIWKYRTDSQEHKQISFGLKVFYENYKDKYWFWEIAEMYRKLIFISVILLFDSESDSQIGFAVIAASASGVLYTIFRPIKDKFEDRLQTFVLWVIFFNVCLGAIYSQPTVKDSGGGNNSTFINVMFLILNSAVLIVVVGKGIHHLKDAFRCKRHQSLEMMEPLTYEH